MLFVPPKKACLHHEQRTKTNIHGHATYMLGRTHYCTHMLLDDLRMGGETKLK